MRRRRTILGFAGSLLLAMACGETKPSVEAVGREANALSPATGPSFEWAKIGATPARNDAAFAFDSRRGRFVLFGGSADQFVEQSDTFEYDGGVWRKRFPLVRPPPRAKPAATFDSHRGVTVMFGGGAWSRIMDDTWEWDGDNWRLVPLSTPPPGRLGAAMTYDTMRRRVVMHGGEGRNDTWEFDGVSWTERTPAVRPGVDEAPTIAFDADRAKTVLVLSNHQTWEWEGTTWTRKTNAPTANFGGAGLTYDPELRRVRRFFDQSYADWDGTTWTRTDLDDFSSVSVASTMAYEPTSRRTVLINAFFDRGEVWEFHDGKWTARGTEVDSNRPDFDGTPRTLVSMQTGGLFLIADMETHAEPGLLPWTWTGGGWDWDYNADPVPGAGPAAFDEARGKVVLFKGCETWESTGSAPWVRKTLASEWCSFGAAAGPVVFDPVRSRVVMLRRDRVLEYDGIVWRSVVPANPPPIISGAVFDVTLGKTITYGESSGLGETWSWDGATWASLRPTHSPSNAHRGGVGARIDFCMTYDARRKRALLFGGVSFAKPFDDLWEWDGTDWTRVATGVGPSGRSECQLGYDALRGQVVLFGGRGGGGSPQNDTWVLRALGSGCATNPDCGLGSFCTDGVCCEATSCGACAACDGREPGRCAPVTNRDDADTCTGASTCSALGECKRAVGQAAMAASDCASGFLVDGVCCDTACNGPCQACRAEVKESGDRSGVCGNARSGADPQNTCAEEAPERCGLDGTCDGRGGCRVRGAGVACGASVCVDNRATGKLCDGLGACGESSQGVSCGAFGCEEGRGCRTACAADAECGTGYRCQSERCVVSEAAFCDGEHVLRSPDGSGRDCGAYKCVEDACKTSCTSVSDCIFPNQCSPDGRCVSFGAAEAPAAAGCSVGKRSESGHTIAAIALLFAITSRSRSRKRGARS